MQKKNPEAIMFNDVDDLLSWWLYSVSSVMGFSFVLNLGRIFWDPQEFLIRNHDLLAYGDKGGGGGKGKVLEFNGKSV